MVFKWLKTGFFVFFATVLASLLWTALTLPDVRTLKDEYPKVQYSGPDELPLITLQKTRPASWTRLQDISRAAIAAVVISEDWAFYQHHGVDLAQMKEAAQLDWERGEFFRGASTITQQVVKNVFLNKDKNLIRKTKEIYLAVRADRIVGKRKILEVYLNIAEWGPGIFGIRRAAEYYFQKTPDQLTAKEGAFLAMMLPSPIRYGESFRKKALTEFASGVVSSILDKMTQAGHLTPEEALAERKEPLPFEVLAVPSPGPSNAP